jgi:hypothetical protein
MEYDKRLADKEWRINHLYTIKDKETNKIQFKRNKAQDDFNKNRHTRNIILKSRQLGFCLDPNTRILTTDLRWIPIVELSTGQEIIAVDEFSTYGRGKGRKMKSAIVQKVFEVHRKAYRISFDDGRSVVCTAQHPWLSRKIMKEPTWRSIEKTERVTGTLAVGNQIRWITKPWDRQSFEDGWFGGILDGEGSIAKTNVSAGINASQRDGEVWNRMVDYCVENKYHYRIEIDKRKSGTSKLGNLDINKICIGRMDEMFRLIGQTRPSRFLNNRFWENRELPGKKSSIGWATITKIEELGEQKMIDLQTSAKTYIAEGFVSHNTTDECIDILDDTLFTRNFNALIINYEQKEAIRIFSEKIQFAWENYFPALKSLYTVDSDRANQITFGFGNGDSSTIAVADDGRGGTYNRVHITELAKLCKKYPAKASKLLESTMPAVPTNGRVDIESTAEGSEGLFYDMFWDAYNRERKPLQTEFKAHFYNWTWDEEIERITVPIAREIMDQVDKFDEYQKLHNLTDKQVSYYYLKWISLNKSWDKMRQEYPTTPEEAFIGSGAKMFTEEDLEPLKRTLKEGRVVGDWTFYEQYIDEQFYCVGVDVAEGSGQDSSTAIILNVSGERARVVATYSSNEVPPDELAYEIVQGAERYGNPIVAVERNNHGHATLTVLKGIYGNIYTEVREDKVADKITEKLGWWTSGASKPKMMYELSSAIRNNLIEVSSKHLLEELRTYDKGDIRQIAFREDQTKHWDLLMALAIAYQMQAFAYEDDGIETFKL